MDDYTVLIDRLWLLLATLLVFGMQAGFLMLEAGRVRSKNSISVAQKNVSDMVISWIAYFGFGYWLMFGNLAPLGTDGTTDQTSAILGFLYQLGFCATAATIVSGGVAERMTYVAYLVLAAMMASVIYPLVGRWVWGDLGGGWSGSWLAELGFVDFAGSSVVHGVGAWVALAGILAIGPRHGRFTPEGKVKAIAGHNAVFSLLGVLILLIGWFGFNGGAVSPADPRFAHVLLVTLTAASFGAGIGMVAGVLIDKGVFNPSRVISGLLGGLVAITACAHLATGWQAVWVGCVGGLVSTIGAHWLLHRCRLDDPVDAVATHGMAGVVGTLAVAFVGTSGALPAGGRLAQAGVQLLGVIVIFTFSFGLAMTALLALGRWGRLPLRVSLEQEQLGLNHTEHGEALGAERLQRALNDQLSDTGEATRLALSVDDGDDSADLASAINALMERQDEAREIIQAAEQRALFLARHDELTGLPNRRALAEDIVSLVAAVRPGHGLVIACIDLDGFKAVNDGYGHARGDILLKRVAARLQAAIRPADRVFRTGGDEFVLVASELSLDTLLENGRAWSERLIALLSEPYVVESDLLKLGASIGLASYPEDDTDPKRLVHLADLALYAAKAAGKGQVAVFEAAMDDEARHQVELEAALRQALANQELEVFYQPQHASVDELRSGFEALLRWNHPSFGVVSPVVFIPIAERLKLMDEIGAYVLRQACRFASQWPPGSDGEALMIAVNVSPSQFGNEHFIELVDEVLADTGLAPERLELEITEEMLIGNLTRMQDMLSQLRQRGISVAVDDFGSGQTSLQYLSQLPISRLKIDRAFVSNLFKDQRAKDITQSIVMLGHRLGFEVVAEGVENRAQATLLQGWKCDQLQGFLYDRPMTADRVTELLHGAGPGGAELELRKAG